MTVPALLRRPGLARGARWALALAVAFLLLVAAEARTAPGVGGVRASRDAIRVLFAALGIGGALLAWRWDAKTEAAGFCVSGLALLAAAGVDAATQRWASSGLGGLDVERRLLAGRVASRVLALGGTAALGMYWLKIPVSDLLRAPERRPKSLALAFVLGVATFPLLNAANAYGNSVIQEVLASGTAAAPPTWPALGDVVLRREPFPESSAFTFTSVALRLAVAFPLLEILLHGVLRQAFGRWGAIPFVVGTAFLAPLLVMDFQMSFAAFSGAIVTGLFAARTASLLPGFVFWTAVIATQGATFALR